MSDISTDSNRQKEAGMHVRNIVMDLLLTLITCGLYNFYIQYVQINAINDILKTPKYSFIMWLLLTLVTCGMYHIYHEYIMTRDLVDAFPTPSGSMEPVVSIILTVMGLPFIADAMMLHVRYFALFEVSYIALLELLMHRILRYAK